MIDIAMFRLIINALRRESRRRSVAFMLPQAIPDRRARDTIGIMRHREMNLFAFCSPLFHKGREHRDCRVQALTLKNILLHVWNPPGTPPCPEQTVVIV